MCPQCKPEYCESCYICGHRFREFEPFYLVKRLMDQGGEENPRYGVRYGKCMECRGTEG